VSRFFAELSQLSGGSFTLEVRDVLAGEEHAAVLVRERACRGGRPYETDSLHLWRLRDGQFAEWWRYPLDTYADDEFWS
jgi:ketosteroid isomerase-like protein